MKKTINYEKDIIFKTKISEICSISLEHKFDLKDKLLTGKFILSGEYKVSELSVNKEPFYYELPLEYEFEESIIPDSLKYEIEDFEYTTSDDTLSLYIDFGIRYDEIVEETPIIPEIEEVEEVREEKKMEEEINDQITTDDKETYVVYHTHVIKDGETLKSLAEQYSVSEEIISEYNPDIKFELNNKLIIPEKEYE